MPEELENQGTTEETAVETQPEVEAKEEPLVPLHVVQELREQLRELREDGQLRGQQLTNIMSEYQKLISNKSNKMDEVQEDLDPEVLKAIKPYLRPFEAKTQQLERELEEVKRSRQQIEAERYIEKNLPNLNEIREDLVRELQSYSPEEQAEIAANPREVVRIGKMITKLKTGSTTVKSENRSRARAETGTTSTRPDSTRPSDYDDNKLDAWLRERGFL